MEFKSQICTTKEQSERLLGLGLKPETADMHHYKWSEGYWDIYTCPPRGFDSCYIPAWSLHRLIEMCNKIQFGMTISIYNDEVSIDGDLFEVFDNTYDNLISIIERLIKLGHFKKECLNEK